MSKKNPSKKEMKSLFKKHGLNLGFPVGATTGETVTDWSYWYHYTEYSGSDLRKFREIIEKEYSNKYRLFTAFCGGSVGVERI